jgi:hypothetical protein
VFGPNGVLVFQAAGNAASNQLTWLDRAGKPLAKVGEPKRGGAQQGVAPASYDQNHVQKRYNDRLPHMLGGHASGFLVQCARVSCGLISAAV